MYKTILITGATGFLGSHLCNFFQKSGYHIIGLKRSTSDISRLNEKSNSIQWINCDTDFFADEIVSYSPNIVIHCAWDGVSSSERDSLPKQIKNLELLAKILAVLPRVNVQKFIGLGSQAEYGFLDKIAFEDQVLAPHEAYGKVKVLANELTRLFCTSKFIQWYWLRVFSVFGENESESWLIPSLIKRIVNNESSIAFSSATQKVAYIYIEDFVKLIAKIVEKEEDCSGVYNISGDHLVSIRSLIEKIVITANASSCELKFGAISLRHNQSTLLQGNMDRFASSFGLPEFSNFDLNLKKVVKHYVEHFTGLLK